MSDTPDKTAAPSNTPLEHKALGKKTLLRKRKIRVDAPASEEAAPKKVKPKKTVKAVKEKAPAKTVEAPQKKKRKKAAQSAEGGTTQQKNAAELRERRQKMRPDLDFSKLEGRSAMRSDPLPVKPKVAGYAHPSDQMLRARINGYGLGLNEMGEKLGVPGSLLNQFERGNNAVSTEKAYEIAKEMKGLDVSPTVFAFLVMLSKLKDPNLCKQFAKMLPKE